MLVSKLCDHSDDYILVKGTVTIISTRADAAAQVAIKVTNKLCSKIVLSSLIVSQR